MKTILLAAGALAVTLCAGQALAAKHSAGGAAIAGPKQPIPYAQLDAYLKDPQAPPFRGNRMPFAGIPDAQARADLIAYLQAAAR